MSEASVTTKSWVQISVPTSISLCEHDSSLKGNHRWFYPSPPVSSNLSICVCEREKMYLMPILKNVFSVPCVNVVYLKL